MIVMPLSIYMSKCWNQATVAHVSLICNYAKSAYVMFCSNAVAVVLLFV